MNMMSCDRWITFSNYIFVDFRDNHDSCCRKYNIYYWCCPALIVSTSLSDGMSPAYGAGICWITHQIDRYLYSLLHEFSSQTLFSTSALCITSGASRDREECHKEEIRLWRHRSI